MLLMVSAGGLLRGEGHMRRLSAAEVARLKKPGRYAVGDNLYLQISTWHTKAWVFRYTLNGAPRHMGMGPCDLITLADARAKARDARRLLLDGIDPLEAKRSARRQQLLATTRAKTFKECAEALMAAREAAWRRSAGQWEQSLRTYVYPHIGELAVGDIDTAAVMSVLQPIWNKLPETASRVRGRIEAVLSWAKVRGLRDGDNPARWRGHLDQLLPARAKVKRVEHFAALPYDTIGVFMAKLRNEQGTSARALEFAILTATRSGEVLGARWDEIKGHTWAIPPERMKGGREHRVPLSDRALALLPRKRGGLVFPGAQGRLGPNALTRVIKRMGYDVTVHGFRSSFRDWAAETTAFPNHVVEMALAHTIPSAVEASYRRGDLFEKRRELMEAWSEYCSKPGAASGAVVPLRQGA